MQRQIEFYPLCQMEYLDRDTKVAIISARFGLPIADLQQIVELVVGLP